MVSGWWSFCRDFGDGGSRGGFVDDGIVGCERGDEGMDGEVVGACERGARQLTCPTFIETDPYGVLSVGQHQSGR